MGAVGWLRWSWRQLTSMRVALILLFMLALASIPGSLFPQRGINQAMVTQYFQQNPGLAPWLDRFGLFDVFTAPWFAAIYLLLFISLVGCVLPRMKHHWTALRTPPPPAPRNLDRLPDAVVWTTDESQEQVLDAAEKHLRSKRFRVRRDDDGAICAEKGYMRETGNLVFHGALVILLLGVAFGSLFGYRGNVLVREDEGFSNTLTQYDSFKPGRLFGPDDLQPFSFDLEKFTVSFEAAGKQRGAPREFAAQVNYRAAPEDEPASYRIEVNKPLEIDGSKVFLVGWGYAPRLTVRDGDGNVVLKDSVAFLPQDGNFTSTGVVKAPDARPQQLGLQAIFLPTTSVDPERGPISLFPAAVTPGLFMSAWVGDLGLDDGIPQSIYKLETGEMDKLGIKALAPGDTWDLADGAGSVTFDGVAQFATFSVARDPGGPIALIASVIAIAGLVLSLFVRRRRLWVRVGHDDDGRTVVRVAGLARTENGDPGDDLDDLIDVLDAPDDQAPVVLEGVTREQ